MNREANRRGCHRGRHTKVIRPNLDGAASGDWVTVNWTSPSAMADAGPAKPGGGETEEAKHQQPR
jgi:hypothetical protein